MRKTDSDYTDSDYIVKDDDYRKSVVTRGVKKSNIRGSKFLV